MGKQIRCRVGLHQWANKWDNERGMAVKECQRCDKRIAKGVPPNTGRAPMGPPG
jgi:hypothetical protein